MSHCPPPHVRLSGFCVRFVAYELLCPGEQRAPPAGERDSLYPELLSYGKGDLRVLISTEMVRVLSHSSPGAYTLNYTVHFR